MKEEGPVRRRFSSCAGISSVFSPRADGRKLVRNASFGGYNELSPALPGSFWFLRFLKCTEANVISTSDFHA